MHKIAFLGHPMGASGTKFLTQRNFVAEFYREFSIKLCVSEPPFGGGWED